MSSNEAVRLLIAAATCLFVVACGAEPTVADPLDAGDTSDVSDAGDGDSGAIDASNEEPVACGGSDGTECPIGLFCLYEQNAACGANGTGFCSATPESCLETTDLRCGCDGLTYENDCAAHRAGGSVASKGACQDPTCKPQAAVGAGDGLSSFGFRFNGTGCVEVIGTFCDGDDCDGLFSTRKACFDHYLSASCFTPTPCDLTSPACGDEDYCAFEKTNVCGGLGPGICRPQPLVCKGVADVVCGCDNHVYSSPCEANSAGTDVRKPRACDVCEPMNAKAVGGCSPASKYTWNGSRCVAFTGCGCIGTDCDVLFDDKDACLNAFSDSGCAIGCGGRLGSSCPGDQFCRYSEQEMCGYTDGSGVCAARPAECPPGGLPYCGCDGETYPSQCAAFMDGVSTLSEGACVTSGCEAQEVVGVGDGTTSFGFAFDGTECVEVVGTLCGGGDCSDLFPEKIECFTHFLGFGCISAVACGQAFDSRCEPDEFCAFPEDDACGAAGQSGVCTPRPEPSLCAPRVGGTQCGCNGDTFTNGCLAQMDGHDVNYPGPCAVIECRAQVAMGDGASDKTLGFRFTGYECVGVEGESCEGADCDALYPTRNVCFDHYLSASCFTPRPCELASSSCGEDDYCAFEEANVCGVFGPGVCRPQPLLCTGAREAVCGCDGEEYSNICAANRAGSDVSHHGSCGACGGMDATAVGTCKPLAKFKWNGTRCVELSGCSCEGVDCNALFDNEEACLSAYSELGCAIACGGRNGSNCAKEQFCRFADDAACGYTDASGLCVPRPSECPPGRQPYCGCDGETYSSQCAAWMDGVSTVGQGPCMDGRAE